MSSSSPSPNSAPLPTSPLLPASPTLSPPATSISPPQSFSFPPSPAISTSPNSSSPLPPAAKPPSPPPPLSPPPPRKLSPSIPPPPERSSGSGGRRPPSHVSPPSPPPPPPSSNSVSTELVVGLTVAGVVILLLLYIACSCCFRKKQRRRRASPLSPSPPIYHFHGAAPSLLVKDHEYEQHQNWHNAPPPADHVVKVTPNPPLPPLTPRSPHPPVHFHPPPPIHSSSGGSMSSYSGSENPPPPTSPGFALGFSRSAFTYEELAMATDGFSDANLLGQGGFGYVHKGTLPNGKEVAVKQLKSGSGQGEREFQTEVEIISRVHHKHLVTLVGYCIADGKRLLVYEFIPNNTLEFHLHEKGRPTLDWPIRLKIALGSAKGLAYLHEDCHPKIIHRDIKASNILLDLKFEAKVADFGLAKIASETNTHVSTRVMGTFGYLAPEYASTGKLTDKSDVFSFGVMLLELITGRRPYDSNQSFIYDSLVDWARPLLTRALDDNNFDVIVDPHLNNQYNAIEMRRMIACAASAVRHSSKRRPLMSQIVRALEGDVFLEDLNEGVKPSQSSAFGSYTSSDYDAIQYIEDIKNFRKIALGSQEYGGSGYSEQTSEYGQIRSASSSEGRRTYETEKADKPFQ